MDKYLKTILQVVGFALAFGIVSTAVKYGLDEYREKGGFTKGINELEEAAKRDTSDRTETEKLTDASKNIVTKRLEGKKGENITNQDLEFAAGVFAAQYGRQVYVVYNYCKSLGVDTSPYSNTYEKMHTDLYKHANTIMKKRGTSVEESYKFAEHQTLKYVEKEIRDMRTMLIDQTGDDSITLTDACAVFNLVAENQELMKEISFSINFPDAYRVLMQNFYTK